MDTSHKTNKDIQISSSNKRLIKNSLALYLRSFLSLAISLYTSRVVLISLGAGDFGIYNVVAGFVSLVIFMNNTLAGSASRFLSFEIGKIGTKDLKRVFTSILTIHFLFAIIMGMILESFGMWFVANKLIIPLERVEAAKMILHFSTVSATLTILMVPANALLIAHERMNVFAYLGLFQVFFKLIIALLLTRITGDSLVIYGVLLLISSFISFCLYHLYCQRKFDEYILRIKFDREKQKEMFAYTGWGIIGSFANMMKLQGVNMLLNMFFGPVVNAARGIAMQINSAIATLVTSFTQALNPQIVKNYAANQIDRVISLVSRGSRLSFYLLLIVSLPILFNTEAILNLWLVNVPDGTIVFTRLIIINSLIECFAQAIGTAFQATGKIKVYQIAIGSVLLLNVPLSYIALKIGYPAYITLFVSIFLASLMSVVRVLLLKKLIPGLKVKLFIYSVYIKSIIITVITVSIYVFLQKIYNIDGLIISSILLVVISICSIMFIGLDTTERKIIYNILKQRKRM